MDELVNKSFNPANCIYSLTASLGKTFLFYLLQNQVQIDYDNENNYYYDYNGDNIDE